MKVTVVTLYDDGLCEHYVAVVEGVITPEERDKLKRGFKVDGENRSLYFRETETCKADEIETMSNIDGDAFPSMEDQIF